MGKLFDNTDHRSVTETGIGKSAIRDEPNRTAGHS